MSPSCRLFTVAKLYVDCQPRRLTSGYPQPLSDFESEWLAAIARPSERRTFHRALSVAGLPLADIIKRAATFHTAPARVAEML